MRTRIALLIAFVLAQIWLVGMKRHDTLFLDISPNNTPSPRVFGPRRVGQTFLVKKNGLSRLDLMVGTYQQAIGADLHFELWEVKPGNARVVEQNIGGAGLRDNLYASVEFSPIRRSKGKVFKFVVSAPEAEAEKSVSLWMNGRDIYREGEPLFNDVPARGDLVFRAYAKRPIIAELGRITAKYPGILGNTFVFVLAVLFFEAVQVIFLWRLLGHLFGGTDPHA